jgi:hypothetical protein
MSDFYIDVNYNKTGTIRSVSFTDQDVLHYGKKGMKWGVRKRTVREERERGKRFKAAQNRRVLSDDDLNNMISRLEKEKKLKNLVEEDLTPGRRVAKQLFSESGQKVVKTVAAGAAMYGVKKAIESKFNLKDPEGKAAADIAVGYIAPKLKK